MAKIKRFEDIDAWKDARLLVKQCYLLVKKDALPRDFGFKDQLQHAAVSIMSNIAEGFERGSNKEFVQYLYISRASAGEVRSLIYAAFDLGYITQEEFSSLMESLISLSRQIGGFISYLKQRDMAKRK